MPLRFEYRSPGVTHRHIFVFSKLHPDCVDIMTVPDGQGGAIACLHRIKNGEIILRGDNDNYTRLLPDAQKFVNKLIKLKAFF